MMARLISSLFLVVLVPSNCKFLFSCIKLQHLFTLLKVCRFKLDHMIAPTFYIEC